MGLVDISKNLSYLFNLRNSLNLLEQENKFTHIFFVDSFDGVKPTLTQSVDRIWNGFAVFCMGEWMSCFWRASDRSGDEAPCHTGKPGPRQVSHIHHGRVPATYRQQQAKLKKVKVLQLSEVGDPVKWPSRRSSVGGPSG